MISRRLHWLALVALPLACEGAFLALVGPLAVEADPMPVWHLARCASACLLVLVLPGLPWARALAATRRSSPGVVLGLAAVLSALFEIALVRGIRLTGVAPSPWAIYFGVVAASVAGLAWLEFGGGLIARVEGRRRFLWDAAVGLAVAAAFFAVHYRDATRPTYRYFRQIGPFLTQEINKGTAHRFEGGFSPDGEHRWRLEGESGVIRIDPRDRPFPLRLIVLGPHAATVRLSGAGLAESVFPLVNITPEPGENAVAGRSGSFPDYQSMPLAVDLPPEVTEVAFAVEGASRGGPPVRVEDYSNLPYPQAQARFEEKNAGADLCIIAEAFNWMDDSVANPRFLAGRVDLPAGYLMGWVVGRLAGRSMAVAHVLFALALVGCYLLACEILHEQALPGDRWAFVFPALVLWPFLVHLITTERLAVLPDALFALYLLTALLMLAGDRTAMFLAASVPASLTRYTGAVLCALFLGARLIAGPRRKKVLPAVALFGGAGAVLVAILVLLGMRNAEAQRFGAHLYAYTFDRFPDSPGQWIAFATAFLGRLFRFSAGLVVPLLIVRSRTGAQYLIVVAAYSFLMMNSEYQPPYWFIPLAFFVAVGAGSNVLAFGGRVCAVLLAGSAAFGLSVVVRWFG